MLALASVFSGWGWLDIFATLLVAIGVLGELWAFLAKVPFNPTNFPPLESKKKNIEKWSLIILCVGVFLEVVALPQNLSEVAALNHQTGELVASNLQFAATVEGFRSNNVLLEKQLAETKIQLANAEARLNESVANLRVENSPMDFGEQFSFVNTLKQIAGIQVELRSVADSKAQQTAELLRSSFIMADCPVINFGLIPDIGEQGVVIGYNVIFGANETPAKKAAYFLLKVLTERGVPSEIIEDPTGFRVRGVPTNAIIVAVCQRPNRLHSDFMIVRAKEMNLLDQKSKILPRIGELLSKRFVPNSKELAEAQVEVNSLNLQENQIQNEQNDLSKEERKLDDQIDKEEEGTNSMARGLHMRGNTFSGNGTAMVIGRGTNSPNIFMHGTRINPPPLQ